jgi:glycogen synthase
MIGHVSVSREAGTPPPRRVLMTADGVGGVWQYATDLAAELERRGVEVLIAVMGPPLTGDQRDEALRRGLRVVDKAYRLEWMEDPWEDVAEAGEWLLDAARSFLPDVVHLNGYCHAVLPWRAPVIVAGHSCVRSWWRAVHRTPAPASWERYSREVARGLKAASTVITPTAAMLHALRQEYGPLRNARVIPNARAAVLPARPDFDAKCALIFTAGRLWDEAKNIAAVQAVAPSLSWPVYVAGDTTAPGRASEQPGASVRSLGRLPAEAIRWWYGRAAIYALPARYEPFGLSVLEAASAGCALVLGDIDSLRENWDGAAVFVDPEDRRALAAALGGLIAEPARRRRLARRAMDRAARFTTARMAAAYADVYAAAMRPRDGELEQGTPVPPERFSGPNAGDRPWRAVKASSHRATE